MALGVGIVMLALGLPLACGGVDLSPLARCKLEALRSLPEDPGQVTLHDAVDIVQRVRACHQAESDGGQ
jgi:hypothetical protein